MDKDSKDFQSLLSLFLSKNVKGADNIIVLSYNKLKGNWSVCYALIYSKVTKSMDITNINKIHFLYLCEIFMKSLTH